VPSLLLVPLLLAAVPRAACPLEQDQLAARLDGAYRSYTAFELEPFAREVELLSEDLPCLDAPVAPPVAQQLHLMVGLAAWLDQDPRSMAAAVRAIYTLEPGYEPGAEFAPQGSRIRAVFDTARGGEPGSYLAVEAPPLWVDGGTDAPGLPQDRAALVQWRDRRGVLRSHYLDGLGVPEALVDQLSLDAPKAEAPRHRSRTLSLVAGAALLGGGAALWGAHGLEQRYWASFDPGEAQGLYRANRALALGGYGLATVGGAAGAGALILWEF
jgi:hypothetical protein